MYARDMSRAHTLCIATRRNNYTMPIWTRGNHMCSNIRVGRLNPEGRMWQHQEEGAWKAGQEYRKTRLAALS
jgi:hypothetical protein